MPGRFIDLSHAVCDGLETYPGLPVPRVGTWLGRAESAEHYAPGTRFHIGRIEMVANTGTYIDAPSHRFEQGADIADLPLASVADLPGALIEVPREVRAIDVSLLDGVEFEGRAVLFATGWSRHFGGPKYAEGHPYLTADATDHLVKKGAALVGIDSLNIDDTRDGARPAHTGLLGAGIPIVEHLTGLDALRGERFRFFAVPAPIAGLGSFPVRAFAVLDE